MSAESTLGLDDTLHAVVWVTHEHGLPLSGVSVLPARVQVFVKPEHLRWWVRWLTDPVGRDSRFVVWTVDVDSIAVHVRATREGIEWSVAERTSRHLAAPVFAAHGVTVTTEHLTVSAAAARDLVVALHDAETGAEHGSDHGRETSR